MKYFAFLVMFPLASIAQDLPDEWEYQTGDHVLNLGHATAEGLYAVDEFQEIHITFEENNWQTLLDSYYGTDASLSAAVTINGEVFQDVSIQYKGQTSYVMLPPGAEKMSFSIKLDEFIEGQDIDGYNNLNLNNSFQDPTFLREFIYLQLIREHIPAAKANFTRLFINGESWGLYVNVQQINKDFLEEWFLSNDGSNWRADNGEGPGGGGPGGGGGGGPDWGDGTAALNYLGNDTALYQEYYTLKSTEQADPWTLLVNTCDVLNNTPLADLTDSLPAVMDVDRALWFLACEIALADDDSYVHKGKMDYYAYWEVETGRMVPQEFDGNSVLGDMAQNWGPFYNANDEHYPLMHRLFQVPEYRQRYLAHLRIVIDELLNPESTHNLIDQYSTFIDEEVQNDPKNLYSYPIFLNEVQQLHDQIDGRRNTLLNNSEVNVEGAEISDVNLMTAGNPWEVVSGETPTVTSEVSSPDGLAQVWLYYSEAQVGNFNRVPMFEDGGEYSAQLPAIELGGIMRFYIEAVEADEVGTRTYLPVGAEHDVFYYTVAPDWVESDVVINELMASNGATASDEAGQFEDWIELYNKGDESIDLSGYFISDNAFNLDKWEIPVGTVLNPDEYLIIWADEDQEDGTYHSNFKLSADGENLTLLTADYKIADQIYFLAQQSDMGLARVPNGTGEFIIKNPTFAANNEFFTSIDNEAVQMAISLYPNPVRDVLTVQFHSTFSETTSLFIQDLSGRLVSQHRIVSGSNRFELEVGDLSTGMYFLQVKFKDRQTTRRFVVSR